MVLFKKTFVLLSLITILGAVLRLYRLSSLPPSLNWDEVSHAYNAYSLYTTGHDQWGQVLPIINFRAYGDFPTTLNLYFTIPAIAILGPTDFAARFPHALIGILVIPLSFIAGYSWRKDKLLALAASLFVAIDPWTVFPSRAIFQSNWTVFFLSLALCLYFTKRFKTAILIWGLSLFTYHNTRIFVPLLLIPLALTIRKHFVLIGLVVALAVGILLAPSSRARGPWVSIFNPTTIPTIESLRNNSPLPPLVSKLVYNRPVYLSSAILRNYLGYFSPQFPFFSGGTQYQYSVPKFGLTSWINLPFFYLGLILAPLSSPFVLVLLLLAPIPAAITQDQFAVIRATTMLPLVQLLTAFGLAWFLSRVPKAFRGIFLTVYLVILGLTTASYLLNYSTNYPKDYSSSWQYGYKQMIDFVKVHYSDYDHIVITKKYAEPHEFFLWYWPWDSNRLLSDPNFKWDYHAYWYWVDGFDKFRFVNDWEMKSFVLKPKSLVISSPDNETTGNEIKRINFLNGQPAFIIKSLP